jgi:hypothetical protein
MQIDSTHEFIQKINSLGFVLILIVIVRCSTFWYFTAFSCFAIRCSVRQGYANQNPGPFGQASVVLALGVNVETRLRLKQQHCLFPKAARFEPEVLIGWRNPGARCTADWLGELGKGEEHAWAVV